MAVKTRFPKLPLPPEPLDVQRGFEAELARNPWLAKITLRQGGWLARDLWRLWQPWLEREGLSPERVQEGISDSSPYFLQWVQREIDWEQAVSRVIRSIEPPSR